MPGIFSNSTCKADPLPDVICEALKRDPLIIHNAAFDLLFMDVLLGLKPKAGFLHTHRFPAPDSVPQSFS